jgi:hypothetical protein
MLHYRGGLLPAVLIKCGKFVSPSYSISVMKLYVETNNASREGLCTVAYAVNYYYTPQAVHFHLCSTDRHF